MLLKIESSLNLQAGGDLPFSVAVNSDGLHPLFGWGPSRQRMGCESGFSVLMECCNDVNKMTIKKATHTSWGAQGALFRPKSNQALGQQP